MSKSSFIASSAVGLTALLLIITVFRGSGKKHAQVNRLQFTNDRVSSANEDECPNYVDHARKPHAPFSEGVLNLPFQRPAEYCRTFVSQSVEKVITDMNLRIEDPDLARLFENCFPNTLDTTVLYFNNVTEEKHNEYIKEFRNADYSSGGLNSIGEGYSQTFIVTGDIHAEWLRDSAWQLSPYQKLAKFDERIKELIKGAINLQARYIIENPLCNAFQPPPEAKNINRVGSSKDKVFPMPDWEAVFECKYELDSLVSFLSLTNQYYQATGDDSIFKSYQDKTEGISADSLWNVALKTIFAVLKSQSSSTFNKYGDINYQPYRFNRFTDSSTETLPLSGSGNPVNFDVNLIRSAFRPSDDACIFQYFIPANAYLVTELDKLSKITYLKENYGRDYEQIIKFRDSVNASIFEHGIIDHPEFGKVFAYEIDGYTSSVLMDDANIPSLLSLPDLGFISRTDPLYKNTREMILSKKGNPYYLVGPSFEGIGGPHVGYRYAWPMSLLMRIRTSDDDQEILTLLKMIMSNTGGLGLMHEGVSISSHQGRDFTRPWFAWCNSEFGKTILDLAERKPYLIFKEEYKANPYIIAQEFEGLSY